MTLDEYKNIFKKITPDNAQTCYNEILEGIEKDLGERDAAVAKNGTDADRIRELQDTNHKLFLSQMSGGTGGTDEDEPPEGVDPDEFYTEKIFSQYLKEE